MIVWDVGGPSDALVTVLDDISSSPCNDTDQKHHQMYHFQTWIQWQQTVRKQRIARTELWAEARTRMIRAVGETRLPRWWIIICARGTMPDKIAMCPPVTWSDQSRMFAARFPFNLSLIFLASEWKESLLFLSRPPHSRSDISRCCLNVNMEIIPGMLTLSPLYPPPTPPPGAETPRLSALSPALVCVSPSLSVALWHSPCEHLPDTQTHTVMILRSGQ